MSNEPTTGMAATAEVNSVRVKELPRVEVWLEGKGGGHVPGSLRGLPLHDRKESSLKAYSCEVLSSVY
ncbi:hypothetical protein [Nonomuraea typhae]|uniref:hypothetical protein n=1 Tax=Nonomuraea typhae TaxID=2603600 RepID=UPI0012F92BEF|nr:hypothetical protein [Nonomuraea typhae]